MKTAVIVDAYSAGNLLAPEFAKRGYRCLHVQTTDPIWKVLLPTFRPEDFEKHLIYRESVAELAYALQPFDPICVIPGTETGVELADALSERLDLPTNGTLKSPARRNKYLMIETLRRAGIPVARQIKSSECQEILDWVQAEELDRIVIKPIHSAGTDRVAICHTREQIEAAFDAILGKTNMLGLADTEVLAQEFLEGTEYFLNTVSCQGEHHFTDIWRYQKRSINGRDCVYDRNDLRPPSESTETVLRRYVTSVLQALDIHFGPAHAEVILTRRGPMLVEIGTRLDGLSVPDLNRKCVGYSPLDLTVDAYTNPEAFFNTTAKPYSMDYYAYTVYLTSYHSGKVKAIPGEEKLRSLSSLFQMRLRIKPGSLLTPTIDYFTAPGFLSLVHSDPDVLESDYQTIRNLEKTSWITLE